MPKGRRPKSFTPNKGVERIKQLPSGEYSILIEENGKIRITPGLTHNQDNAEGTTPTQTAPSQQASRDTNTGEDNNNMDFYDPNNPFDKLRQTQHNGPVGVFNIKKPPPIVINSELSIMQPCCS